MCEGIIFRFILKISVELLVSFLDVNKHTNCDESYSTYNDQNDDQSIVGFLIGLKWFRLTWLRNLPVIAIKSNIWVRSICVVKHYIIIFEEGSTKNISVL